MKNRPLTYLIIAGEGGHFEQAKRICKLISSKKRNVIIITEFSPIANNCIYKTIFDLNISGFSKNHRFFFLFFMPFYLLIKTILNIHIIYKYRPVKIITLGPFFSVSWTISALILKIKNIHIETWSRFSSLSITTKFLLKLPIKVFYQNKSLDQILSKKAEYIGRL